MEAEMATSLVQLLHEKVPCAPCFKAFSAPANTKLILNSLKVLTKLKETEVFMCLADGDLIVGFHNLSVKNFSWGSNGIKILKNFDKVSNS